jgi:hypothetical protein
MFVVGVIDDDNEIDMHCCRRLETTTKAKGAATNTQQQL